MHLFSISPCYSQIDWVNLSGSMQLTKKYFNNNKIAFINQLTMAINGPNEAPNTTTTIKPSLTKFKGEKSQIFMPKILSCFSTRW